MQQQLQNLAITYAQATNAKAKTSNESQKHKT